MSARKWERSFMRLLIWRVGELTQRQRESLDLEGVMVTQHQRHNWDGIYPTQKTWSQKSLLMNALIRKTFLMNSSNVKIDIFDGSLMMMMNDQLKVFAHVWRNFFSLVIQPQKYIKSMSYQSYLSHSQSRTICQNRLSLLFVEFSLSYKIFSIFLINFLY